MWCCSGRELALHYLALAFHITCSRLLGFVAARGVPGPACCVCTAGKDSSPGDGRLLWVGGCPGRCGSNADYKPHRCRARSSTPSALQACTDELRV